MFCHFLPSQKKWLLKDYSAYYIHWEAKELLFQRKYSCDVHLSTPNGNVIILSTAALGQPQFTNYKLLVIQQKQLYRAAIYYAV